jgi:CelD/BcsL family acetyltransferase involved in cellulose biosynthesis
MNAPGAMAAAAQRRNYALGVALPATCKVDILTPVEALAGPLLVAEWDALAAQVSEPNPFTERWYLAAALQALDSSNVRVLVIRDHGLVGVLPIIWQSRYADLPINHIHNWLNHNAFLGTPLVRKGAEQDFWRALFAHLDQAGGNALFLHLSGLATDGPVVAALQTVCDTEHRRFALVHHEERALLEKGLSPDAYLETHVRGKKRKELRRQHKRLSEEGTLSFHRSEGAERLDEWIDQFLKLEQRGWKGANGSALACADDTSALFAGALQGAAAAGKLERLELRLNGRAIAMLANFLTPPGAFSFKTAFDENYARFSPGVLLQIENLALLERESIDWCDSCAAADHPMIDSLWAGRRAIGRYSIAIGGRAKRAVFATLLAAEKTKAKFKGKVQK